MAPGVGRDGGGAGAAAVHHRRVAALGADGRSAQNNNNGTLVPSPPTAAVVASAVPPPFNSAAALVPSAPARPSPFPAEPQMQRLQRQAQQQRQRRERQQQQRSPRVVAQSATTSLLAHDQGATRVLTLALFGGLETVTTDLSCDAGCGTRLRRAVARSCAGALEHATGTNVSSAVRTLYFSFVFPRHLVHHTWRLCRSVYFISAERQSESERRSETDEEG
jgi:hypothetical protein